MIAICKTTNDAATRKTFILYNPDDGVLNVHVLYFSVNDLNELECLKYLSLSDGGLAVAVNVCEYCWFRQFSTTNVSPVVKNQSYVSKDEDPLQNYEN